MQLRPYQEEANSVLSAALEMGKRNGILVLPTAGGKTFTAVSWLYEEFLAKGKSVMWVTHRKELLTQAKKTFQSLYPNIPISHWNAQEKMICAGVTFVSVRSTRTMPATHAGCAVVDEAHHDAAAMYQQLFKKVSCDFKLGLTATPDRLDGRSLGFTDILYQKNLLDLAKLGYLPWPKVFMVKTQQRYKMARVAGDFTAASLRQLDNDTRNNLIIDHYLENAKQYRKTMIFVCSQDHAYSLQEAFLKRAPQISVLALTSADTDQWREQAVEQVHAGGYDVVINVELFTEGVDWNECRSIFLVRPTMSKTLYLQMVGRGARLDKGAHDISQSDKKDFNVVHFIDDISQYAHVAEDWALELLGWDDKDVKKRKQDEEDEEEILKLIKDSDSGLKDQDARDLVHQLTRKLIDVAAFGVYSNKFTYEQKVLLTREDLYAIRMFEQYMNSIEEPKDYYPAVNRSAGIFAPATQMTMAEWTSLCWAWYFKNIKGETRKQYKGRKKSLEGKMGRTFQIVEITPPDCTREEIAGDLEQLMSEDEQLTDLVKKNAHALLNLALRNLRKDGAIAKNFSSAIQYKDFTSRTFELTYVDRPKEETFYFISALSKELSKVVGSEVRVRFVEQDARDKQPTHRAPRTLHLDMLELRTPGQQQSAPSDKGDINDEFEFL